MFYWGGLFSKKPPQAPSKNFWTAGHFRFSPFEHDRLAKSLTRNVLSVPRSGFSGRSAFFFRYVSFTPCLNLFKTGALFTRCGYRVLDIAAFQALKQDVFPAGKQPTLARSRLQAMNRDASAPQGARSLPMEFPAGKTSCFGEVCAVALFGFGKALFRTGVLGCFRGVSVALTGGGGMLMPWMEKGPKKRLKLRPERRFVRTKKRLLRKPLWKFW